MDAIWGKEISHSGNWARTGLRFRVLGLGFGLHSMFPVAEYT